MSFLEKLKNYADGVTILHDWLGSETLPVSQATAQARANICLECHHNRDGTKLTETIADEIKKQIEFKNHLELRVDGEKSLHTCEVCQCVNRLQIWCPDKLFTTHSTLADTVRYPDFCWKRRLVAASLDSPPAARGEKSEPQNIIL